MDVGSLTGEISLEDNFSAQLAEIASRVNKFASDYATSIGRVNEGSKKLAGTGEAAKEAGHSFNFFGGILEEVFGSWPAKIAEGVLLRDMVHHLIAEVKAGAVEFAITGSEIDDSEQAFHRLSGSVGNADGILAEMRKGVVGTISDFDLMKSANKLLESGVAANAKTFGTMTQAARVLSREGFGSIPDVLSQVDRGMQTGMLRGPLLKAMHIDLAKAEHDYALTIGETSKQLSPQEKLFATRGAILKAENDLIAKAGFQQTSLAEKITAAQVSIANWTNDLAKAIAASPQVNAAMDAISRAWTNAFGEDKRSLLEEIVGWVNNFADGVKEYGPVIIAKVGEIKDEVLYLWHAVEHAWSLVPDWFKKIAVDAALAGGATLLAAEGLKAVSGGETLSGLANLAQIWSVTGGAAIKAGAGVLEFGKTIIAAYAWGGISEVLTAIGASFSGLWTAILASPLLVPALFAAGIAAVYKVGEAIINLHNNGMSVFERDTDNWVQRLLPNWVRGLIGLSTHLDKVTDSVKLMSSWKGAFDKFDLPKLTDNQIANMAPPPPTGAQAEFTKKVEDGVIALQASGKELEVIQGIFASIQKSPGLLADYEVLKALSPELIKVMNAGFGLNEQQIEAMKNLQDHTEALRAYHIETLSSNGVTLSYIEAQKRLGENDDQIAITLNKLHPLWQMTGADVAAFTKETTAATASVDRFRSLQESAAAAERTNSMNGLALTQANISAEHQSEVRALMVKMDMEGKGEAEISEAVAEVNKRYGEKHITATKAEEATLAHIRISANDKVIASIVSSDAAKAVLSLHGTALEIHNIETARDAKLAALGDEGLAINCLYTAAAQRIIDTSKHDIDIANHTYDVLEERMRKNGVLTRAELVTNYNDFKKTYDDMVRNGHYTSDELSKAWKDTADAAKAAELDIGTNWHETFKTIADDLKTLPELLIQAFTGGGGVMGALKALATKISTTVADALYQSLASSSLASAAKTGAGKAWGLAKGAVSIGAGLLSGGTAAAAGTVSTGAATGVLGSSAITTSALTAPSVASGAGLGGSAGVLGGMSATGVGAVVAGAIVVGIIAKHMWDAHKAAVALNKERNTFTEEIEKTLTSQQLAEAGGEHWKAQIIGVRDAYVATGRTAAEGEAAVRALWDAKTPEAYAAAVKNISSAINAVSLASKGMDEFNNYAEKYHLSLNQTASELLRAEKALETGGYSLDQISRGMGDDIQKMITDSLNYGIALPTAMKPLIQSLIDQGFLLDTNKGKITDINSLSFQDVGSAGQTAFEKMTSSIDTLVATIKLGLHIALTDLENDLLHLPHNLPNPFAGWVIDPGTLAYLRAHNLTPEEYFGNTRPDLLAPPPEEPPPVFGAAVGGIVPSYYGNVFTKRGTDTVPAMLTPEEQVLPVAEAREYRAGKRTGTKDEPVVVITKTYLDGKQIAEALTKVAV